MSVRRAALVPVAAGDLAATREFYAHRPSGVGAQSLDEVHRARSAHTAPPAAGRTSALTIETGDREVAIRITLPHRSAITGVHLAIHGGGFYLRPSARDDARNERMADALGVAVIGVDYRLAPENPWPAAPDDCEAVAHWIIDHAQHRFGTTRLTIGGMSAGATLTMTTLLRLRDQGSAESFAGAVLEAGTYDLSGATPAGATITGEYFIEAYAGHVRDRTIPDISPIFGEVSGLPPTLVVIGTDDVLLDDNLAMVERLTDAGNNVDLRLYPDVPHGFTGHATPVATQAQRDIDNWLGGRADGHGRGTPGQE
ncbi:alpha/beta hydrolase fold domain-containing protein [Gordonia sp. VNQ95]|jgi:acetyl esterase/lipase|uniref:alpha/beta hydrolase n=1 Tax=Gordonia TaxID=2053 RepID=UPI0032B41492